MTSERYRVLAIDYGTKRLGLAMSDEGRMLASARGTIPNSATLLTELQAIVERENVREVVLGIPLTLANSDSEMTREVRTFEARLRGRLEPIGIKLTTRDERLTSVIAGANVASRGMKKSRREQKGLHDEEAARILLQEYLDSFTP